LIHFYKRNNATNLRQKIRMMKSRDKLVEVVFSPQTSED